MFPQVALISEEVAGKQQTLRAIASQIADVVVKRAAAGKNYGVVLLPEGLIESVAELKPVIGTPCTHAAVVHRTHNYLLYKTKQHFYIMIPAIYYTMVNSTIATLFVYRNSCRYCTDTTVNRHPQQQRRSTSCWHAPPT